MMRPAGSPEYSLGLGRDWLKFGERTRNQLRSVAVFTAALVLNVLNAAPAGNAGGEVQMTACEAAATDCGDVDLGAYAAPAPATTLPIPAETTPSLPAPPEIPPPVTLPPEQPPASPPSVAHMSSLAMKAFDYHEGIGIDVSWPNCGVPIPEYAAFGIVGVNGGSNFEQNPCLAQEASEFQDLSLYVNTGYPGYEQALAQIGEAGQACAAGDNLCVAREYGRQAGLYSVEYAHASGVYANYWWLDVETMNSWRGNHLEHQANLQGQADAIAEKTAELYGQPAAIGFYSVPGMWSEVTGGWQNGFPAWRAIGERSQEEARATCLEPSFTGGDLVMVQYVQTLDHNLRC